MRLIRLHVEDALSPGTRVVLAGTAAAHARRVLRLEAGDAITLFNGDGSDYPSKILAMRREALDVEVQGKADARAESPLALRLVQGIARAERMDLVVQKATELGVAAIQPVVTARSVVKLDRDGRARKLAHWRGVAIAACEQCGRARVPPVAEPVILDQWLVRPAASGSRLLLAAGAASPLGGAAQGAREIELFVGPEGGIEEPERAALERAGYVPCRLGPRILRSETAAIAAIAVLQATAGDFTR
jgi:16S rRNA (uracil1498-N3)-methyltransferase